jgi:hypothetical protein
MNGQKCSSYWWISIQTSCSASTDVTTDFLSLTIQNQYNTDASSLVSNLKTVQRFTDNKGVVSQSMSDYKIPSISGAYHGYFKVAKSQTTFTFFTSDDEVTWIQLGSSINFDFNYVSIFLIHFLASPLGFLCGCR